VPVTEPTLLRELHTCEDVTAAIKADAIRRVNETIDAQIESTRRWWTPNGGPGPIWFEGSGTSGGMAVGAPSASDAKAGSAAPSAPSSGASSSGSGGSGSGAATTDNASTAPATDFSQTNTQVKGVDEADIVKNDGKYIYLIHGGTFQVLTAWPAQALATASKLEIEGQPSEMFVANGKAVVFSTVTGVPIYSAAGKALRSQYYDGYGDAVPVQCLDGYCWQQNPLTKVTVLGVDGTKASVQREMYFEGNYVSSRRIDGSVRVVLQSPIYGPRLVTYPDFSGRPPTAGPITSDEYIAGYEALRKKNIDAINATTIDSWLPYRFEKSVGGGISSSLTSCEHFFVPGESTSQYGVTQLATFDLAKPDGATSVAVLSAVDTVYSNEDDMILAARAWVSPKQSTLRPIQRKAPFIDFLPSNATHLHRFNLKNDPVVPQYVGSGVVPGHVLNQFSIDQRDDVVRIATTEQRQVRTWISDDEKVQPFVNNYQVNRVLALKPQDGGGLHVVGDVGDLAPNERIYSTRFVGDKGYVVTYRQVDPLFVIDFATPEKLQILGQLTIPGFSEYMHPLDDGHLLTIGRDADGQSRGLDLQIFDVTQPTQPRLVHKFVFDPSVYGTSEAEQNHKAFTYFPERKLLSFPFYGYSPTGFRSSAEVFKIDIESGITKLGSVDHSALFGTYTRGYCGGWFSPEVRRTLFMEDVLYSISYAGVIATDTKDLTAKPLGTALLEAPYIQMAPWCAYPNPTTGVGVGAPAKP
jgi:uncharacterized secreted protein with C-terminal beta-propeller domain